MAPQVSQLQVPLIRGRHYWQRRGRWGGLGQPITRLLQIESGPRAAVGEAYRGYGYTGASPQSSLGIPQGAAPEGLPGWEGAAHKGWWAR